MSNKRWMCTLAVLLVVLAGAGSCGPSDMEAKADCADLGGTYNPSANPKCALPFNAAQACTGLGGTYNSSATPRCTLPLTCVAASSQSRFDCKDAGGFDSTCASVKCPAGFTLTGGGGACAAGNSKLKSLFPSLPPSSGQFNITCDKQGVDPEAIAICCKL